MFIPFLEKIFSSLIVIEITNISDSRIIRFFFYFLKFEKKEKKKCLEKDNSFMVSDIFLISSVHHFFIPVARRINTFLYDTRVDVSFQESVPEGITLFVMYDSILIDIRSAFLFFWDTPLQPPFLMLFSVSFVIYCRRKVSEDTDSRML